MLDLKRLLIFTAVAREGSFSGAASCLNYTQPAISHHVARLELELGVKLLNRHRAGLELTPAGEVLLSHARGILSRVADAEAAVAEVVGSDRPRVRVGAFATASATLVSEAIAVLRRMQPEIRLSLIEGEAADTLAALRSRELDIAVVFDSPVSPLQQGDDVAFRMVGEDPMLLALPRGHPAASRDELLLKELVQEDWIEGAGADSPCSLILLSACEKAGFQPRIAFNSGNYQVVQRLVAVGVGVALIPRLAVSEQREGIVLRSIADVPSRRVFLATQRTEHRLAAVSAVFEVLESTAHSFLRSVTAAR